MFFNKKCCCNQQNDWQENSCGCDPIIEQPIEKCIERNICHKVEQE